MPYVLEPLFTCSCFASFPRGWPLKALTTGKYRRGLWKKLLGRAFRRHGDAPCVWFHGVSVGEIHLLRQVVAAFRQRHLDWRCVISTTTDTGFDEADKRFPDLPGHSLAVRFHLGGRAGPAAGAAGSRGAGRGRAVAQFSAAAKRSGVRWRSSMAG